MQPSRLPERPGRPGGGSSRPHRARSARGRSWLGAKRRSTRWASSYRVRRPPGSRRAREAASFGLPAQFSVAARCSSVEGNAASEDARADGKFGRLESGAERPREDARAATRAVPGGRATRSGMWASGWTRRWPDAAMRSRRAAWRCCGSGAGQSPEPVLFVQSKNAFAKRSRCSAVRGSTSAPRSSNLAPAPPTSTSG